MAEFVEQVPEVEIVDGLVHTKLGGQQWVWKPSTMRAFVEGTRRKLDMFDRKARGLVEFKRRA